MGRKSTSPPSGFWVRLIEAFKAQGLPTTQNGVAKLLKKPHRTVWDWYHGQGEPDLAMCRVIAIKGKVQVDWLITGRPPKYPISGDPLLSKILETCLELDDGARKEVLRAARRWQADKDRQ